MSENPDNADTAARALRIDALCDRFEDACQDGEALPIPEFLRRQGIDPEVASPTLLQNLAKLEAVYRTVPPSAEQRGSRIEVELESKAASGTVPKPARTRDAIPKVTGSLSTNFPTIPGYVILGELGGGGMGDVYRAEDSALGRQVAIKVLRPGRVTNPSARARFIREARAAATVSHDHVVPIYHVGDAGGNPYIIMPVLVGESLEDRLKRLGPLPPAEVSRIGREAALGLAAAHERGLVHRDVKPANLWLEAPKDRVRVLDFGLASTSDSSVGITRPGEIFGTPAYMAPEQANSADVDARADLFGLGAVLYRAATGKPAFEGPTLTAVLRSVAEREPPAPHVVNPAISRPLSDLLMRMLAKDPAGRPANACEVVATLAAMDIEVPIRPREVEATQPPRRWRWVLVTSILFLGFVGWSLTRMDWEPVRGDRKNLVDGPTAPVVAATTPRYRGMVDVLVERVVENGAAPQMIRLDDPRALPLRQDDRFRIEGTIDPPAYLYVVWTDPSKDGNPDVTPVYPWDPEKGWNTRPAKEEPTGRVSLPPNPTDRYTAPDAKPGVATIILMACSTPLTVPDSKSRKWFEQLPDLPLPPGGERSAAWFDDYLPVTGDSRRPRGFKIVGTDDPFAKWQRQLKTSIDGGGGGVVFQTAISFARTGGK